jgi:hypothetical protein
LLFSKILSFDWAFWFQWMVATTLGWILGGFIFPGLALLASGILIAILQWLVLQGRLHNPLRWVLATSLGWAAGYLLTVLAIPAGLEFLDGLVLGLAAGIAGWLVLRGELRWAGWWIPFSVIGWTTGLTLLPGFTLTGTLAGALTGLALEILLRNPKPGASRTLKSSPDRFNPSGRNST